MSEFAGEQPLPIVVEENQVNTIAEIFPEKEAVIGNEALIRSDNNSQDNFFWTSLAWDVVKFGFQFALTYYLSKKVIGIATKFFQNKSDVNTDAAKKALAKRLNRPEIEFMDFDAYEARIMIDVLGPGELTVTFKDIGGLEAELQDVEDNVVLPITLWLNNLKSATPQRTVCPCPTGILLYGRPGTGKSLIAKAIAKGKHHCV